MSKIKPNPRKPNPLALPDAAAERLKEEQDYFVWALRAITTGRWNRRCPSLRCRRNGCQDARRCEPRFRAGLNHLRVTLLHALLEENLLRREAREGDNAGARRALLADARAKGLLPI